MRGKIFFAYLALSVSLFADPTSDLCTWESDPSALVDGKVNALTGRPLIYEEDLVIQGVEPIRIARTYIDGKEGDWRFVLDFAKILETEKSYRWVIWEKDRCPILYKKVDTVQIGKETYIRSEPSSLEKGFSNTSRGKISSRTHLRNNRVLIDEKFKYMIVQSADGTERTYKKVHGKDREYQLLTEHLPNGNWVLYEYQEVEVKKGETRLNLVAIRTTNPTRDKTFARADFIYEDPKRKQKRFWIVGSDGQRVEYEFQFDARGRQSGSLVSVESSHSPGQMFGYADYKECHKGEMQHRLHQVLFPLNRCFQIEYYKKLIETVAGKEICLDEKDDTRMGCVKRLLSPVGEDAQLHITHSFVYEPIEDRPYFRKVSVYDIDGNRFDYVSDWYFRLHKIERFSKEGKCLNGERYEWGFGTYTGCLLSKTFFDGNLAPLFYTRYVYDARGNVLEEKFCGQLSGKGAPILLDQNGFPIDHGLEAHGKKYRYSSSQPNLVIEEADGSLRSTYRYLPGTDLPQQKLTYDKELLVARQFFVYNADHILVREVADDGSSDDPNDLTGVMVRTIRQITPLEEGPFVGLPHVVEEKFLENGRERDLRKTIFTYTVGAKIAKQEVYDANGVFRFCLETKYDEKGRPVERTNAMGQREQLAYDAIGNRVMERPFAGRSTTRIAYDCANRPTLVQREGDDGLCLTQGFSYDRKHRLIGEVDPRGARTEHRYDPLGRCLETQFPEIGGKKERPRTQQTYDSMGNATLSIDEEGNSTKVSYNSYGKPLVVTYSDGVQEKYEYFLDGRLRSQVNPKGVVTAYEYDGLGHVVRKSVISPGGTLLAEERFLYKGQCLMEKIDAEGHVTSYRYDGAGRKVGEECEGETVAFAYDALGRLHRIEQGDWVLMREYDLLDRLIEEREESIDGKLSKWVAYEYDAAGNQKTIARSVSGETTFERRRFDSLNRLVERVTPRGYGETVVYHDFFQNEWGQKVVRKVHTDAMGLQTIETFDSRGRVVKEEMYKDKTLGVSEKTYSKKGLLTQQSDTVLSPDGSSQMCHSQWVYDTRGRLKMVVEADQSPEAKITQYAYTPCGDIAQVIKPDGTRLHYGTNDLGFLSFLSSSDGTVQHQMEYDRLGHLLRSDGVRRKVDGKGRLLEEKFPCGVSIENTYDTRGRRTAVSIPEADVCIDYEYDAAHLTSVRRKTFQGASLYAHRYLSYDLAGNLLEEEGIGSVGRLSYGIDLESRRTRLQSQFFAQEILAMDPVGNIRNMTRQGEKIFYSYDDLYQLTSDFSHEYTYDSLGGRLTKDGNSYTLNALHQITSHCVYDGNGNVVQMGDLSLKYDALDRLIRMETPTFRKTFTYDFLHRCLSSTTYQGGSQEITYFLHDGQNEIGSFDAQGRLQEFRVLGATPHAEIGAAIAIELQGKIFAPIHDLQGNVAALIPLHAENPTYYRYTAFGEETVSNPVPNPWRFSSKRSDEQTGLVFFGRRFYCPLLGCWLTPDPAGPVDGMNLYVYLQNNPLTHIDLYGFVTFDFRLGWQNCPWNSQYSWTTSHPVPPLGSPPPLLIRDVPHTDLRGLPSMYPLSRQAPVFYLPGIGNTWPDALRGGNVLLKTFDGNANVRPMYASSLGFFKDLVSVYRSKRDPEYSSFASRRLNRELRSNMLWMDALQDPRKLFLVGFSRGAADIYHAVKDFSPIERNRLIITACGPTLVLPRDLGFSVTNYVSQGDWCSFFCNRGLKWRHKRYERFANVPILSQADGFFNMNGDHFFESRTYQGAIKEFLVPQYHTEYGELR